MKNIDVTKKITHGMYVLTTKGGGCIVDAVAQVGKGEKPTIIVSVNKKNFTNQLIKLNQKFALSIIGKKVNPKIIETFGFKSSREIDKFKEIEYREVDGVNIISNTLGYLICDVVSLVENETHTVFFGQMFEGDITSDDEVMTYHYYQEHKEELIKTTTKDNKTAWVCTLCGYIYVGWNLPENFVCPKCKQGAEKFIRK